MALTVRDPEVVAVGSGEPVTLFAHGVGASIAETRPLGGGLAGTRVFATARGHGATPAGDEPVTYDVLGRDLVALADRWGATRALGVSMGAGALLSLLTAAPDRLERAVLFLPAALDAPRPDGARRLQHLADAIERQDAEAVTRVVTDEVPVDLRSTAAGYIRARTAFLLASPGLPGVLRALPSAVPVSDRELLRVVVTPVLVLAQEGDPLHPVDVAREIAELLPRARLAVFDRPGVAFREPRRLRELVGAFLVGPGPAG